MKPLSEHKLALEITKREGKKISLPIGQVKEVLRIALDVLAKEELLQVLNLLSKHRKRMLIIAVLCVSLARVTYAQQIMSPEDIRNIEAHLPKIEKGPIRDALLNPKGIWYNHKTMGVMIQAGEGVNGEREFSSTGKLGVMNGLSANALRGMDLGSFPLNPVPGGLHRCTNVSSIKKFVLPDRPKGTMPNVPGDQCPALFYDDELEGFADPDNTVTGFDYTFPKGMVFLEPIAVDDPIAKQHYICIIRARIRMDNYWDTQSVGPVRTADECRQLIAKLQPHWRNDPLTKAFMAHLNNTQLTTMILQTKTPGNSNFGTKPSEAFNVIAKVDTPPPLSRELIIGILHNEFRENSGYDWKPGCAFPTTSEDFFFVPKNSDLAFVPNDPISCARCHEQVQISARRHDPDNGKSGWGPGSKEGVISFSHVEPSTLTDTPNPNVVPRKLWLDTGIIAEHTRKNSKTFPVSIYRRIVVPTQENLK